MNNELQLTLGEEYTVENGDRARDVFLNGKRAATMVSPKAETFPFRCETISLLDHLLEGSQYMHYRLTQGEDGYVYFQRVTTRLDGNEEDFHLATLTDMTEAKALIGAFKLHLI